MGRRGITKEDVFKVAQEIAQTGEFPTMHAILQKLGTGSLSTIHKHLLSWKKERLLQPAVNINGNNSSKVKAIYLENHELQETLKSQVTQNTNLAAQIFELEQQNHELKDSWKELLQKLDTLRHENQLFRQQNIEHENLLEQIKLSHAANVKLLLSEKNIEIGNLKEEIKMLHISSMEMVRKTSFENHDALMIEKIKNININDRIKKLSNKVEKLDELANLCKNQIKGKITVKNQCEICDE